MKGLEFALMHEQNGILMYEKFSTNFNEAVFSEILAVKKTGFEMLNTLINSQNLTSKNAGLSLSQTAPDFSQNIAPSCQQNFTPNLEQNFSYENVKKLDDALILALSYETKTALIYDEISSNLKDAAQIDLIFRLWATSENEYKKALKSRIFELNSAVYQTQNSKPNQSSNQNSKNSQQFFSQTNEFGFENLENFSFDKEKINELAQIFQKFSKNQANKDDIMKILTNPYSAFVAGAALGGIGGVLFNQILSKDENE